MAYFGAQWDHERGYLPQREWKDEFAITCAVCWETFVVGTYHKHTDEQVKYALASNGARPVRKASDIGIRMPPAKSIAEVYGLKRSEKETRARALYEKAKYEKELERQRREWEQGPGRNPYAGDQIAPFTPSQATRPTSPSRPSPSGYTTPRSTPAVINEGGDPVLWFSIVVVAFLVLGIVVFGAGGGDAPPGSVSGQSIPSIWQSTGGRW